LNLKQKISHLRALYHLACADKQLAKAEAVYIRVVADHLGVDLKLLNELHPEEPELELPDREYKIYGLFHRLALIIMVDNAINENEKTFCFNLGIKMGLHPNAVGEIIDHAATHGALQTTPKEVMAIFRKYLN
jgi:hypothetical protein